MADANPIRRAAPWVRNFVFINVHYYSRLLVSGSAPPTPPLRPACARLTFPKTANSIRDERVPFGAVRPHMEVAMRSFSVDEWCALHDFSRSFFYKLASPGEAPKTFKIGRCTRISEAAAVEWVASREAVAA